MWYYIPILGSVESDSTEGPFQTKEDAIEECKDQIKAGYEWATEDDFIVLFDDASGKTDIKYFEEKDLK